MIFSKQMYLLSKQSKILKLFFISRYP